jgi:hypothetical protein
MGCKDSTGCHGKQISICGSNSIVITRSGNYKLCKNSEFDPIGNNDSAIIIAVSDVNIDFCGFKLSQNPTSTTADNVGIKVNDNLQNIHIFGGTIQGFSSTSIKAGSGITNLTIDHMNLQGLATGARLMSGLVTSGISVQASAEYPSTKVVIRNVLVHDFLVNSTTVQDQQVRAIALQNVKDVDITDVRAYNLKSTALVNAGAFPPITGVYGLSVLNSQNVNLTRCNVEDSSCTPPNQGGNVVGDIYGFIVEGFVLGGDLPVKNLKMIDCHVSDLSGTRRALGVVYAQQVSQVHVEKFTVQNVALLDETAPAQSRYAVELIGVGGLGTPEKFTFTDCHFQDVPNGFGINGANDVLIQKSTIIGRNEEDSSFTNGIRLQQSFFGALGSNIVVEDGVISRFKGSNPGNTLPSNGVGINVVSEATIRSNDQGHNVVDQNEIAFNDIIGLVNTASGATEPPLTKDLITRNIAYNNGILTTPQYPGGSQYAINTGNNTNQVLFQTNQASAFPSYSGNASPLSNFDLQP